MVSLARSILEALHSIFYRISLAFFFFFFHRLLRLAHSNDFDLTDLSHSLQPCLRSPKGFFRCSSTVDLINKEWGLVGSALFITLRHYINFTDFSFDLLLQICDAVAVAKILNVTLVIPRLEVNPVWQDSR